MLVLAHLAILGAALVGCSSEPRLQAPEVIAAPYDGSRGDVLWGVAPLRNEAGTTLFDPLDVSDKVVAAASQIRGIRVLPLNRTIIAMRALKMNAVVAPEDARRLAQELGVDGLLVGSITAYDPYDPPKLGLSLALLARPGAMQHRSRPLDPRLLEGRPYDPASPPTAAEAPVSVVTEYLDGKNHQVLMDLKQYAEGRHDRTAALSWRRYLASMDLFTEYAAWHAVGRLLDAEWVRLARTGLQTTGFARPETAGDTR